MILNILFLKIIYNYSNVRIFRVGINQIYIRSNIEIESKRSIELPLGYLLEQGFVFPKTNRGNHYWLPTKLGRQYIESKQT